MLVLSDFNSLGASLTDLANRNRLGTPGHDGSLFFGTCPEQRSAEIKWLAESNAAPTAELESPKPWSAIRGGSRTPLAPVNHLLSLQPYYTCSGQYRPSAVGSAICPD
jgi:hypothetical protein